MGLHSVKEATGARMTYRRDTRKTNSLQAGFSCSLTGRCYNHDVPAFLLLFHATPVFFSLSPSRLEDEELEDGEVRTSVFKLLLIMLFPDVPAVRYFSLLRLNSETGLRLIGLAGAENGRLWTFAAILLGKVGLPLGEAGLRSTSLVGAGNGSLWTFAAISLREAGLPLLGEAGLRRTGNVSLVWRPCGLAVTLVLIEVDAERLLDSLDDP